MASHHPTGFGMGPAEYSRSRGQAALPLIADFQQLGVKGRPSVGQQGNGHVLQQRGRKGLFGLRRPQASRASAQTARRSESCHSPQRSKGPHLGLGIRLNTAPPEGEIFHRADANQGDGQLHAGNIMPKPEIGRVDKPQQLAVNPASASMGTANSAGPLAGSSKAGADGWRFAAGGSCDANSALPNPVEDVIPLELWTASGIMPRLELRRENWAARLPRPAVQAAPLAKPAMTPARHQLKTQAKTARLANPWPKGNARPDLPVAKRQRLRPPDRGPLAMAQLLSARRVLSPIAARRRPRTGSARKLLASVFHGSHRRVAVVACRRGLAGQRVAPSGFGRFGRPGGRLAANRSGLGATAHDGVRRGDWPAFAPSPGGRLAGTSLGPRRCWRACAARDAYAEDA